VTRTFTIEPLGDFSLREAALFGFGQRLRPPVAGGSDDFDGIMRMAFCLDPDYTRQVGIELRQDDGGLVHAVVHGAGDAGTIRGHVARVLSLDHDARGFADVGRRDPVIGRLQAAAPGLRPPLFYSPYEAAVWSVLSARRPGTQMSSIRAALSRAHGATFGLAGVPVAALPTPQQLLGVDSFPGIDPDRLARMHGVARAARDGLLATEHLRGLGPDAASEAVQQIKGIGPFYGSLGAIRAIGFTDVLPTSEPKALELVRQLYDLPAAPTAAQFEAIAEPWRPWRTWTTVLVRSAAPRLLSARAG
jgi:DNA-3-methyladenine glycosylase II